MTTPSNVALLSDPPRRVPFSFRISSLLALSGWELFAILMGTTASIPVLILVPDIIPAVLILGVLAVGGLRVRRYRVRVGVLTWGKVATVTNADEIARDASYSGTKYTRIRLRQANGWAVSTRRYSGPGTKSTIDYAVDDTDGTLTLRGLPYAGGVILADPRNHNRALCVSSFPFSVEPDRNGEYVDRGLPPWSWVGIGFTILVHVALLAGAWYAVDGLWVELPG